MIDLSSEHVVRYLAQDECEGILYLVMERCDMTLTQAVGQPSCDHSDLCWQLCEVQRW